MIFGKDTVNAIFHFVDGTKRVLPVSENTLMEQMKRPINKRLYRCGIEFSYVKSVEVI